MSKSKSIRYCVGIFCNLILLVIYGISQIPLAQARDGVKVNNPNVVDCDNPYVSVIYSPSGLEVSINSTKQTKIQEQVNKLVKQVCDQQRKLLGASVHPQFIRAIKVIDENKLDQITRKSIKDWIGRFNAVEGILSLKSSIFENNEYSNNVITHEIIHSFENPTAYYGVQWNLFSEGITEYFTEKLYAGIGTYPCPTEFAKETSKTISRIEGKSIGDNVLAISSFNGDLSYMIDDYFDGYLKNNEKSSFDKIMYYLKEDQKIYDKYGYNGKLSKPCNTLLNWVKDIKKGVKPASYDNGYKLPASTPAAPSAPSNQTDSKSTQPSSGTSEECIAFDAIFSEYIYIDKKGNISYRTEKSTCTDDTRLGSLQVPLESTETLTDVSSKASVKPNSSLGLVPSFLKGGIGTYGPISGGVNFADIVLMIFRLGMAVASVGFLIVLLFGGVTYLNSGGNQETSTKARKILLAGLIGLLISLAAYGLGTMVLKVLGVNSASESKTQTATTDSNSKKQVVVHPPAGAKVSLLPTRQTIGKFMSTAQAAEEDNQTDYQIFDELDVGTYQVKLSLSDQDVDCGSIDITSSGYVDIQLDDSNATYSCTSEVISDDEDFDDGFEITSYVEDTPEPKYCIRDGEQGNPFSPISKLIFKEVQAASNCTYYLDRSFAGLVQAMAYRKADKLGGKPEDYTNFISSRINEIFLINSDFESTLSIFNYDPRETEVLAKTVMYTLGVDRTTANRVLLEAQGLGQNQSRNSILKQYNFNPASVKFSYNLPTMLSVMESKATSKESYSYLYPPLKYIPNLKYHTALKQVFNYVNINPGTDLQLWVIYKKVFNLSDSIAKQWQVEAKQIGQRSNAKYTELAPNYVRSAEEFIGDPYNHNYDASQRKGCDCSGLVGSRLSFDGMNITGRLTTSTMSEGGKHRKYFNVVVNASQFAKGISRDKINPGDIILFRPKDSSEMGHVVMVKGIALDGKNKGRLVAIESTAYQGLGIAELPVVLENNRRVIVKNGLLYPASNWKTVEVLRPKPELFATQSCSVKK